MTKEVLKYLIQKLKDLFATKEEIPTKTSDLTNDSGFLTSIPSEYITETELGNKGYLTEHQDISGKADISDLSTVATSGSYNDLTNKPTIPNKTSQLQNDSGYLTSIPNEYVTDEELNAKGYLTSIPSEYITETELNSKGYLTQHQDISGKVDKVDGKGLSTNDYTTAEKNKLEGIADNANNYTHPNSHPANIITQDSTHRFVTDADITAWNAKYNKPSDGIPYKDISLDIKNGLISDNERATWNNKAECLNLISPDLTTALYTPLEIISAMSNGNVILMAVGGVCSVIDFDVRNSPNYVVLQRQFNSIKQIVQITIYEDKTFNFVPLELATVKTFSGTLGTFYSSANSLYYYQNVEFPEVTADDEPIIDLITTVDGFEKEQEEWNKIFKAEAVSGSIAFYVSERTTIPLNFSVKVVK